MSQLSPEIEDLIQQKVAGGLCPSADEAIAAAIRLLNLHDRRLLARRASIAAGFASIERGEGIELTASVMDEIEREADVACQRGEQPHADACP
jgi:Arc/MetJ-type ribon-helix-helix transcriptional regulator